MVVASAVDEGVEIVVGVASVVELETGGGGGSGGEVAVELVAEAVDAGSAAAEAPLFETPMLLLSVAINISIDLAYVCAEWLQDVANWLNSRVMRATG